jgi:hypothetical protein
MTAYNGRLPVPQPAGKVTIYVGAIRIVVAAGATAPRIPATISYPRRRAGNGRFAPIPSAEALLHEEADHGS